MTTKIRATVPNNEGERVEKLFVYDRQSRPLGGGYTANVYKGWEEDNPENEVAVKIARSTSNADMERELEILGRLYAPQEPGGHAVIWAAEGREIDAIIAYPCMIMELVGDENQLARRLAQIGDAALSGTNVILERERIATDAALQYAHLLARMDEKGIITRGDRKAADFRLLPDGDANRLVVLDWNRAEIIDIEQLRTDSRWSESYIRAQAQALQAGKIADIRIFGHWWAEFVLDRAVATLPALDDAAWGQLTRGFRDILLRADAAGSAHGFDSADELQQALAAHSRYLSLSAPEIVGELSALEQSATPPPLRTLRQELAILIDIGTRRGLATESLWRYETLAKKSGGQALEIAERTLEHLKTTAFNRRDWETIRAEIDRARQQIGREITPDSAAAHLLLLRWDSVAAAGQDVKQAIAGGRDMQATEAGNWQVAVGGVLDAMTQLPDSAARDDAKRKLSAVKEKYPAYFEKLEPLELELALHSAADESVLAERFDRLATIHADYAVALRAARPSLDDALTDYQRKAAERQSEEDARKALDNAADALFSQFKKDVDAGHLPPEDGQSASERRRAYLPLLTDFYEAKRRLSGTAAGSDENVEHTLGRAEWLFALLDHILHFRRVEAAGLLRAGPPGGLPAASESIPGQIVARWLNQLDEPREPLWPDEIAQGLALLGDFNDMTAPQWNEIRRKQLADKLRELDNKRRELRSRLDPLNDYAQRVDWPQFLKHVTTGLNADIDLALSEAIAARIEVWQPPHPAADAFPSADPAPALNGYRAETLLALRTAERLPQRLEEIENMITQIEARKKEIDEQIAYFGQGYQQQMNVLKAWHQDIDTQVVKIKDTRKNLEGASLALDAERKASADDPALAAHQRQLSTTLLSLALDQAGRLELDAAEQTLTLAQGVLIADSAEAPIAQRLRDSITQLKSYRKAGNDIYAVGSAIDKLKRYIDKPETNGAQEAWKALQEREKNWSDNLVLALVGLRVADARRPDPAALVDKATRAATAEPPLETPPDESADKSSELDLGPTTTLQETQEVPPPQPSFDVDTAFNKVKETLSRRGPSDIPKSLNLRAALTGDEQTIGAERLIREGHLSRKQLAELSIALKNAHQRGEWDDDQLLNSHDNFLYIQSLLQLIARSKVQ